MKLTDKEIVLITKIITKAEFIWSDKDIDDRKVEVSRCCLYADKPTSESERAIALACGLSFTGIKKLLAKKIIADVFVDDECLHITIRQDIFDSIATDYDKGRIDD